jgi:hypothetical protein
MSTTCDTVRETVTGTDAFDRTEIDAHLSTCAECQAFVRALSEVDATLAQMSKIDAPDAFVDRVLAAAKRPEERRGPRPPHRARRLVRVLLVTGTTMSLLLVGLFSVQLYSPAGEVHIVSAPGGAEVVMDGRPARQRGAALKLRDNSAGEGAGLGRGEADPALEAGRHAIVLEKRGYVADESSIEVAAVETPPEDPVPAQGAKAPPKTPEPVPTPAKTEPVTERTNGPIAGENRDAFGLEGDRLASIEKKAIALREQPSLHGKLDPNQANDRRGWVDLVAERSRLDGVPVQAAEGYWSNTYVPGDPTYRFLGSLLSGDGIEDMARPYPQPFDAPSSSAIAVTMASDRAAVEGPTRALVQIGLQGAPRLGRRRPSMNVGVVVDATGEISIETAKQIRAVVTELAKAKEIGDRMSLTVAGRPGAMIVAPQRFEYGAVAVALQDALTEHPRADQSSLSVSEALIAAIESVAAGGDESQPLGASAVFVITGRSLGLEVERLSALAHQSAVGGISIGAIGVRGASVPELDRIALAGQGNRRLIGDAAEAEALVDRELASVSRVVARALRLRIRLAPGVKLVDVLGSTRLDLAETTRVKEAERSIDLRLAKSLGIDADRGDDEDGIQIVVPSYYSGDQHVILLDVIVPGPGPVADVQVRYKDLVYLKNGVARARLELTRGRKEPGPLQLAVLENLVSRKVADALRDAGDLLESGDTSGAVAVVETAASLVTAVRRAVPSFAKNPDLARDLEMLVAYRSALERPDADLVRSLKFASRAKILPPIPPAY